MTAVAVGTGVGARLASPWRWIWLAAFVVTALIALSDVAWLNEYPKGWELPIAKEATSIFRWLVRTIFGITRAISAVLEIPLDFAFDLLARGFKLGDAQDAPVLPRLSWVGVTASFAILGYVYGGWRLASLSGLCFLYLAMFGQWDSAMRTLALVAICVPLGVIIGLLVGIAGYRYPRFNRAVIVPALDLAQAMPAYAYLIPMLMLFGTNPVSAMVATLIYAVPPMVRATTLALIQVPHEVREFGHMAGCTRRQHLWRVLVPSARPLLMVGVNQVIMMTLNMVIISSMIGAGGLGQDVLEALRALKVGVSFEAGIAIVLIAIALDRISQAAAAQKPTQHMPGQSLWLRHPYLILAFALLVATTVLSVFVPVLHTLPRMLTITTAPMWDGLIRWININFFDYIEWFRTHLLLYVLKPFKTLLLELPWAAVVGLLGLAGYQLGGLRLAALVIVLTLFPAAAGLWEETVTTVYLVGVSTVIACAIGIPLGVLAARNDTANRVLTVIVDTLQTIPAFVYLIPAVMLFRVGDVSAMIGIILYAITPAIRYTNHGIRQVPEEMVEAAKVSGCTRGQLLWRVQIPLALPEIMLGINQVLMLAIAMDIIAAMIGTSDLGQEVFKALAKADAGRGIVAGLTVAFIGIVADRLISAASRRARERRGLA
jgi:glycine betaine/proline transport system permease protein